MTPPTVLLRVTPEAIETLFTRDHDGNRLRVEWGEAGADGFHDPVISVDYTDNIHAADKATIATLRAQYAAQLNLTIETKGEIDTLRADAAATIDQWADALTEIATLRAALDGHHRFLQVGAKECGICKRVARAALAAAKETP